MTEDSVRSVLRILAIACVTIGAILTIQSIMALVAVKSVTSGQFAGMSTNLPTGSISFWAIAGQMVTPLAGLVLYGLSEPLAQKIVG